MMQLGFPHNEGVRITQKDAHIDPQVRRDSRNRILTGETMKRKTTCVAMECRPLLL